MFLYTSVLLFSTVAVPCTFSAFSERRLLCSSEYGSVWYSYEGPLYYLSALVSSCPLRYGWFNMTYTIIPMFTIARAGYHARVYFKNQLWLEYTQPDVPCEDVKICYITKGETLHETVYFMRKGLLAQGEYKFHVDLNIIDDNERRLTICFNGTLEIKRTGRQNSIS